MTHSVCGGPSEARPGFISAIVNTSAAIEAALAPFTATGIAPIIAAVVAADTFDLTTFCSSDPPPDPNLGPGDYLALLNPAELPDYLTARDRFRQWWKHIYWYDACQCTSVATPPIGPVSNPGPGGSNDGLPGGPGQKACWDGSASSNGNTIVDTGSNANLFLDYNRLFPGSQTVTVNAGYDSRVPTAPAKVLPGGTIANLRVQFDGTSSPTHGVWLRMLSYNAAGTSLGAFYSQVSSGGAFHYDVVTPPLPTGAASWLAVLTIGDSAPGHYEATAQFSYECVAAPNTPTVPCCPPDPGLEWTVNTILSIVANLSINSGGSSPPTSWRDGTRHNALTGSGRLVLAGAAVGARVEITSIPPNIASHPGDPAFYFDLGFITPIAIDVPLRGQRLVFNPQSFALPQFADGIAWTLPTGATINLVELLPVP